MGTLAFFHFLIILSIILNGFNDADGYRCGCRHKRLPRECRSKKPIKGNIINNTNFSSCDSAYCDRLWPWRFGKRMWMRFFKKYLLLSEVSVDHKHLTHIFKISFTIFYKLAQSHSVTVWGITKGRKYSSYTISLQFIHI